MTPIEPIGEVVAANSQLLEAECHRLYEAPAFGSFVRADCVGGGLSHFAVVTHVSTGPFDGNRIIQAHKLAPGELEQRKPHLTSLLRTTFEVRVVGYGNEAGQIAGTPPLPARLHCFVYPATAAEVRAVTGSTAFLRPLCLLKDAPLEDLLVATIESAREAWGPSAPLVGWGEIPRTASPARLRDAGRRHAAPRSGRAASGYPAGRNAGRTAADPALGTPAPHRGQRLPGGPRPLRGGLSADSDQERMMAGERMGLVVRGSLSKGLELKLDPEVALESLRAGMFAIAAGQQFDFFSLVTDLELSATTEDALNAPPPADAALLREILAGDSIYARAVLRPHLMVERAQVEDGKALLPVKTIPGHFTEVRRASGEDVNRVFGSEERSRFHFHIGAPVDMEDIPVCVDLNAFTERSNGIFGKSGTGKTFLTRMVLCGLVQKNAAVNLIFDMHGEYGLARGRTRAVPGGRPRVSPALRARPGPGLYPRSAADRASTTGRSASLTTSSSPRTCSASRRCSGCSPPPWTTAIALQRQFGRGWFAAGAGDGREGGRRRSTGATRVDAGPPSATGPAPAQCRGFLKPDKEVVEDAVPLILKNLEQGIHTVIDFGRYNQLLHYILVANILTRRIDEQWREKTESYLSDNRRFPEPPRLVITIEEAHKFLEPGIAEQTIFGRIARELRKYSVTLLVVDQRPSQIEREVLSQLGTKICCLLDDEHDVEAVLAGTSGSGGLRSVLASLDTRQQALLFGHALPMPVVVKTRDYNERSGRAVGCHTLGERRSAADGAPATSISPMTDTKLPVRVLHVGDVHLGVELYGRPNPEQGYGTRTGDFLAALDRALERAADADLVLFPGDIYKNCDPNPTVQREFASRIRRAARAVPVVIIPGNHDLPNAFGRASSMDIFRALDVENVHVFRQPKVTGSDDGSGRCPHRAAPVLPPQPPGRPGRGARQIDRRDPGPDALAVGRAR